MLGNELTSGRVFKLPKILKPSEEAQSMELAKSVSVPSVLDESVFTCLIKVLFLNSTISLIVYFLHSHLLVTIMYSFLPSILAFVLVSLLKLSLKIYRPTLKTAFLTSIFLYSACGILLILTDINTTSQFLNRKDSALVPNIYLLIFLIKSSSKTFKNYSKLLFLLNTILVLFSFGLSLGGPQPLETSIFQFVFFCLFASFRLRSKKKGKVEDYYDVIEQDEESTPIERVMKMLNVVLEDLDKQSRCRHCEKPAKRGICLIDSSIQLLRSTPNIYSSSLELITKNMNEQDKLFIEQSCSDRSIYSSMNDSDDVKENINNVYDIDELAGVLKQIGIEWNFNTFFVSNLSGAKPLHVCGEYVIRRYNFHRHYKVPELVFSNFLDKLEEGYFPNPYHNSCHAADMMCSFLYLFTSSGYIKKLSSLELFSCILACLAHDLGHKGRNNRFLILSKDQTAIKYNDISVQEMMHVASLYEILLSPDSNILIYLPNDPWFAMRKIVIEMILSTDMAKHFELLGVVKAKYLNSLQVTDVDNADVKIDIFKLGIKCADLGHAAKEMQLHSKWCGLIIQEFFEQGDMEKELEMPVSMYCDRETTDISKSQAGFLQNIVIPIYSTFNNILHSIEIENCCLAQLKRNKTYWSSRRSLSKNQTVCIQKQQDKQKEYLELMEKTGVLKRSITPFIANLAV